MSFNYSTNAPSSDPVPFNFYPHSYGIAPKKQEIYAISDRAYADSMDYFSITTRIARVHTESRTLRFSSYGNPLIFSDRKVLFLLHGFNSHFDEVIDALESIAKKTDSVYDTVIAYFYPCKELKGINSYSDGRANAYRTANRFLPKVLNGVLSQAKAVDIAAHSMGAFLALHTLNNRTNPIEYSVRNLFLAGAAVSESALLSSSPFSKGLQKVDNIYNIYSCRDMTLPIHSLMYDERVAGRPGKLENGKLKENVKFVDATNDVGSHRTFLHSDSVINFMKKTSNYSDQNLSLQGTYFRLIQGGVYHSVSMRTCSVGVGEAISSTVGNFVQREASKVESFF